MEVLHRQQLIGGELLMCALLELVIVRIAYRIDRGKQAPYLSAAAWAIVLGILVCGWNSPRLYWEKLTGMCVTV
jgi:hypothetical protein